MGPVSGDRRLISARCARSLGPNTNRHIPSQRMTAAEVQLVVMRVMTSSRSNQARTGSGEVGSVFVPTCSDFSSGGSTTYFQWSEVNDGSDHQPFGIVRAVLWTGLENTRAEWVDSFGRGPLVVQSGYRCPVHNQNVNGKPNSRHMYGDAADLTPLAGAAWNADEWEILRQCAHDRAGATYIEDYDLDHSHLHCDWR